MYDGIRGSADPALSRLSRAQRPPPPEAWRPEARYRDIHGGAPLYICVSPLRAMPRRLIRKTEILTKFPG